MASFKFTNPVLPEGTMFIFGSWVCIADSAGDFRQFTIDVTKPKTLVASFHSKLNEFVDILDDSLIHGSTRKIEEESASNATPPRAATTTLRSDSFQFEDLRSRSRLGLRNSATELQEANKSESLSVLEKDLDYLLQIGKPEATARRGLQVALVTAGPPATTSTSREGSVAHRRSL
jgi:phage protein D